MEENLWLLYGLVFAKILARKFSSTWQPCQM